MARSYSRNVVPPLVPDDHPRPNLDPLVKVYDVVVDEAETARRHRLADGVRLIGAVDAVHGVAEIEGARPERIAQAACHEAGQIRLALDHLRGRMPVRPFGLARHAKQTLPLESLAADSDRIA